MKALKERKGQRRYDQGMQPRDGRRFYENIPRMLPTVSEQSGDSYEVPAIFKLLAEKGGIEEEMMPPGVTWASAWFWWSIPSNVDYSWAKAGPAVRWRFRSNRLYGGRRKGVTLLRARGGTNLQSS